MKLQKLPIGIQTFSNLQKTVFDADYRNEEVSNSSIPKNLAVKEIS